MSLVTPDPAAPQAHGPITTGVGRRSCHAAQVGVMFQEPLVGRSDTIP